MLATPSLGADLVEHVLGAVRPADAAGKVQRREHLREGNQSGTITAGERGRTS